HLPVPIVIVDRIQKSEQFAALFRTELLDGSLNFFHAAHRISVCRMETSDKLLQDGENAVLGSRRLDGQAREVAGKRPEVANQNAVVGSRWLDGPAREAAGKGREVANGAGGSRAT